MSADTSPRAIFEVVMREDSSLGAVFPGAPFQELRPWRPRQFRVKEFADVDVEFVVEGTVTAMKSMRGRCLLASHSRRRRASGSRAPRGRRGSSSTIAADSTMESCCSW